MLKKGNQAVRKELYRLETSSHTLNESHLKNSLLLENLYREYNEDQEVVNQFTETNAMMSERIREEQDSMNETRQLVTALKRQLLKTNKEREQLNKQV